MAALIRDCGSAVVDATVVVDTPIVVETPEVVDTPVVVAVFVVVGAPVDVLVGQFDWRLLECSCVLESISDVDVCKDDIRF